MVEEIRDANKMVSRLGRIECEARQTIMGYDADWTSTVVFGGRIGIGRQNVQPVRVVVRPKADRKVRHIWTFL